MTDQQKSYLSIEPCQEKERLRILIEEYPNTLRELFEYRAKINYMYFEALKKAGFFVDDAIAIVAHGDFPIDL